MEPSIAEGDVVDLIFQDLGHELRARLVAKGSERSPIQGGEIEIGHLEGQTHGADVADRGGEGGDVVPEVFEKG